MNNAKVTVTKEVAEAIESIKSYNGGAYNIHVIFSNARNTPESDYGTIYRWIKRNPEVDGVHEYFQALINGYQVEKSPEEKVREYYDGINELVEKFSEAYDNGALNSVKHTLDLLGIKIEGVNS